MKWSNERSEWPTLRGGGVRDPAWRESGQPATKRVLSTDLRKIIDRIIVDRIISERGFSHEDTKNAKKKDYRQNHLMAKSFQKESLSTE